MGGEKSHLLHGTLDLLILKALQRGGATHGYGISVQIRAWSKDVLQVEQGSLYPALYRREERGWIDSKWGVSDNNRKAKFYTPTAEQTIAPDRARSPRGARERRAVIRPSTGDCMTRQRT